MPSRTVTEAHFRAFRPISGRQPSDPYDANSRERGIGADGARRKHCVKGGGAQYLKPAVATR